MTNAATGDTDWLYSIPQINTVYLEFGENPVHAEMARLGQSYDVRPWLPLSIGDGRRINYALDVYRRLVLEISPPDWRTTLSGNLNVYVHGLNASDERRALTVTFDFIACSFWHTSTAHC